MPLVIMCGGPSSGKTAQALQLADLFNREQKPCLLLNEEYFFMDRSLAYRDPAEEKSTRSRFKAEVERFLTKEMIVIVDSLNYIKGYRYELYCLAHSLGTRHCIIFCDTPIEKAKFWNQKRVQGQWDERLLDDLYSRLELPNPKQRWDDPCLSVTLNQPLDLDSILPMLMASKKAAPNFSTQSKRRISDPNYLFDLEKLSEKAISVILEASQANLFQQDIIIPHSSLAIQLKRNVNMSELRRLRRQYLNLERQMVTTNDHFAQQDPSQSLHRFIEFLNIQLLQEFS